MAGILLGYFLFGHFIDDTNLKSANWFNVYYVLGGLSVVAFILLLTSKLDESAAHSAGGNAAADIAGMFKLMIYPLVLSFVVCAFFYVLIEQSIMSWLPTFNNKVLQLPASISIIMASILSAFLGLGRLAAGIALRKINPFLVLVVCLLMAAVIVLVALPLAKSAGVKSIHSFADIPLAGFVFPVIGFFSCAGLSFHQFFNACLAS